MSYPSDFIGYFCAKLEYSCKSEQKVEYEQWAGRLDSSDFVPQQENQSQELKSTTTKIKCYLQIRLCTQL